MPFQRSSTFSYKLRWLWRCIINSCNSWRVGRGKKIWKNIDFKKIPAKGMLRKTFLQMLSAEKILQGRNCPTTRFSLKMKWFVSKWHYGILFRLCVALELAHDIHHTWCESRFDFFSCLFQSKARAVYPKHVKKLWKSSESRCEN